MCGVLHDHQAMPPGEIDHAVVKVAGGDRAGRAVGIVQHQQLRAAEDVRRDGGQVGQESVLGPQRQAKDLAAVVAGVRAGDWVTGDGHQGDVAGVNEDRRQHRQGGLGADRVIDFRHRIELHTQRAAHEPRGSVFEGLDAVIGVAAVLGTVDLFGHDAADRLRRHFVVLANAEVDQLPLGEIGQRLPLGSLDLLELIDLGPFAVVDPADAVGKELLKIRIGHGGMRSAEVGMQSVQDR